MRRRSQDKEKDETTKKVVSSRELLPSLSLSPPETHSDLPDGTLTDTRISDNLSFLIRFELFDSVEFSFPAFEISWTSRSSWIEGGSRWFETGLVDSSVRSRRDEAHDEVTAREKQAAWSVKGEKVQEKTEEKTRGGRKKEALSSPVEHVPPPLVHRSPIRSHGRWFSRHSECW